MISDRVYLFITITTLRNYFLKGITFKRVRSGAESAKGRRLANVPSSEPIFNL
jgi:hypothetical protein